MERKEPIIGKITFKIQRFSTLDTKFRFSSSLAIEKHTCNLFAKMEEYECQTYLGVFLTFNPCVSESSWSVQAKLKCWIIGKREVELNVMEFSAGSYGRGWPKFIAKNSIPKECIVDDTLTLEAEIEVLEGVCPTVSFGSPPHDENESYEKVMKQKKPGSLINNEMFSDVVFIIGTKDLKDRVKIFGHRHPIALSSPVFAAMLFPQESGCLTQKFDEKGRLEIEIEDANIDHTVFLTLLRFIYTKEVIVDRRFIHDILYLAEKYDVENFAESLGFLVTPETVLEFVPFVFNVGETHILYKRCRWIINSQIESIINTVSFLEVDDEVMNLIFSSDRLQIKEINLFNAYVKWADHQLEKQGLPVNDKNRRTVMKQYHLIRFPIMTAKEFATGPAEGDILTPDEKIEIFRYINGQTPTQFPTNFRNY